MSREADVLRLSGLLGLVAGLGIGVYQMLVNDPMIGMPHGEVPYWMTATHIHLLGLSLAALLYSHYLDDLFSEYRVATVGAAIIGQWGFPLTLYPLIALGIGLFGPIHNVTGIVMFLVAVAFAVNYIRNGWGTAGT